MIKLLTSGGFGDAAMSLAKIHARFSDKIDEIDLTHIRVRNDNLNPVIEKFYDSQEIKNKVITVHSWDWQKENRDEFDYFLGSGWSSINHDDESSWEINPFPPIKYTEVSGSSVLLNPSSGGVAEGSKNFSKNKVDEFIFRYPDTVIIGKGEGGYDNYPMSLYNKTDVNSLINLISSSEVVISPEGFTAYFAAMCGSKVYVKNENASAIYKRKHPKWDLNVINDLDEISL